MKHSKPFNFENPSRFIAFQPADFPDLETFQEVTELKRFRIAQHIYKINRYDFTTKTLYTKRS